MIDRKAFYDEFRIEFGKLNQKQVQGFEATFDEWDLWVKEGWVDNDPRKLAYIIATDWHEGNKTMQPIKEYGSNKYFTQKYWENKKIAKQLGNISAQDAIDFCGKGKPQLTGRRNYILLGNILGYDLVNNPNLMLNLKIATEVMFEGMLTGKSIKGDFTGKHLGLYFNSKTEDPLNARRIVNGIDCAIIIRGYYNKFLICLT